MAGKGPFHGGPFPKGKSSSEGGVLNMVNGNSEEMIVGLDIGTSKVVAIVGVVGADGQMEIVGTGMHRSSGMKKGVVVNIESTVSAIQRAVEEAELMAGCHIHSVFAGIAGSHIRSLNSHGIVAIRDREVLPMDVERVIDAARAVAIPADQEILHVLPQEFIIDSQGGVRKPLGMSATSPSASAPAAMAISASRTEWMQQILMAVMSALQIGQLPAP